MLNKACMRIYHRQFSHGLTGNPTIVIAAVKLVFLENGKVEIYKHPPKKNETTWKIVGKEVRVQTPRSTMVLKIESNGDLTVIAYISKDGKREGLPKDREHTWKKSNN